MKMLSYLAEYYTSLRFSDPLIVITGFLHAANVSILFVSRDVLPIHILFLALNFLLMLFSRRLHVFLSDHQPAMADRRMITRPYFNDTGLFIQNCLTLPILAYTLLFWLVFACKMIARISQMCRYLRDYNAPAVTQQKKNE